VQPTEEPGVALARRLRTLRTELWPGRALTQRQLAAALGGDKPLSVALISSWENLNNPTPPPPRHLEAYALFFATERSVERQPLRPFELSELTAAERTSRDELLDELMGLRDAARTGDPAGHHTSAPAIGDSSWRFPIGYDITIVVAPVPVSELAKTPHAANTDPDYVRLAHYNDLDALVELYGFIRAVNPLNKVKYRTSDDLRQDDYTTHLILIGGVDWNEVTRDIFRRYPMPVSQKARVTEDDLGAFTVQENGAERSFKPTLIRDGDRRTLTRDIAHFYRSPNPFNHKRTVTVLNGMFSRGTFGAVRALTDARFRDRNEEYVQKRFAGSDTFSVLTQVDVLRGWVATPDWTNPATRLHEWPSTDTQGEPENQ
jgi:transcriptional regulator with XRE-family HTH domain